MFSLLIRADVVVPTVSACSKPAITFCCMVPWSRDSAIEFAPLFRMRYQGVVHHERYTGSPETATLSYDTVGNLKTDGSGSYSYTAFNLMATATVAGATTSHGYKSRHSRSVSRLERLRLCERAEEACRERHLRLRT